MIRKEIIEKNHVLIKANEPVRVEISKTEKGFLLYAYKGIKTKLFQEPILFYET